MRSWRHTRFVTSSAMARYPVILPPTTESNPWTSETMRCIRVTSDAEPPDPTISSFLHRVDVSDVELVALPASSIVFSTA
jgi:hypothetical protein